MDIMRTPDLISWRQQSQHLTGHCLRTAAEATRALGAVQAQDYEGAKWSLGSRMDSASDATIERAIANHAIVRTWSLRGTLHLLAPEDVGWINALLAPRIIAGNRRRYRQLELDETDFATSHQVLQKVLAGGKALRRAQIAEALEAEGISAQGQRAPYLLQRATFDGLICHGLLAGREPTYVLLSEWIPACQKLSRAEALARLATRYFNGYGPSTLQDFAWWSGLPVSDACQSLEAIRPSLVSAQVAGQEFLAGHEWEPDISFQGTHLLPPFDAYLLGYKDRSLVLDPDHTKKVNAGGGMPRPTILLDGKVAGTWKRKMAKKSIQVTIEPFRPLEKGELDALQQAARRYAAFYGLNAEFEISDGNLIS